MRLVTRCPVCATTFKVVRDQLRISDGWVRCGRCSEVFDATLDLQETDDDGVPLAAGSPAPSAAGAADAAQPVAQRPPQDSLAPAPAIGGLPAMDWPAADLLDLGAGRQPAAPATPSSATRVRPSASSSSTVADDPVPIPSLDADHEEGSQEPWFEEMMASTQALRAALQSGASTAEAASSSQDSQRKDPAFTPSLTTPSPIEEAVNAQLQKALRRERIKALRQERNEQKARERAAQSAAGPGGEASSVQEEPSARDREPELESVFPATPLLEAPSAPAAFVDDTATTVSGRSGRSRLLLALACVLALVVLLLQVVREERNVLVAREPRLRPALQSLCDLTRCELSALRQINSITIEGASFSREKENDAYRLVFTLRNGARVPLAMPSVELTLLDTQERALVRRVLSPAQFGAGAVLGPGAESNTSLPLQLGGSEAAGLGPVAGYNLVAFYP